VEQRWEVGGVRVSAAAGTSVGLRYRANFDVLHLDPTVPLAVVADGMGDGRGSAVAGRMAVDQFVVGIRAAAGLVDAAGLRALVAGIQDRVRAVGAELDELTGCTLTALVADAGGAWIVQLGDSRAYRLRDGLLELLTVDHTEAWLGAVYGWYPPDSPAAASARYHLYRYVGHPRAPEPDLLNVSLRPGDAYLLCSDGLAEQVTYPRLAELLADLLAGAGDLAEVVAQLLDDALAAGGRDNATAVLLRVTA
jgi:PPM family protein phosphatase